MPQKIKRQKNRFKSCGKWDAVKKHPKLTDWPLYHGWRKNPTMI